MKKIVIEKGLLKGVHLLLGELEGSGSDIAAMMVIKEKTLEPGTDTFKFDVMCRIQFEVDRNNKDLLKVQAKHTYGASRSSSSLQAEVSSQDDIPGLEA